VLHVSFACQWTVAVVGLAAGHMLCCLSAQLAAVHNGFNRASTTEGVPQSWSYDAVLTHMQVTSCISTVELVKAAHLNTKTNKTGCLAQQYAGVHWLGMFGFLVSCQSSYHDCGCQQHLDMQE
jgi:hypothetical protein